MYRIIVLLLLSNYYLGVAAQIQIHEDSSGTFGIIKDGRWIVEPRYREIRKFCGSYIAEPYDKVSRYKHPFDFIDANGKLLGSYEHVEMHRYKNNYFFIATNGARVSKKKKAFKKYKVSISLKGGTSFLLDSGGHALMKFPGQNYSVDDNGYILHWTKSAKSYSKRGKYGLVKFDGSNNLPAEFDYIESLKYCSGNSDSYVLNKGGKWKKIERDYYDLYGGKYGIFFSSTSVIIQPRYESVRATEFTGVFRINTGGREYLKSFDDWQNRFWLSGCGQSELCGIEGGLWGYLDSTGNEFIKPQYTFVSEYTVGKSDTLSYFIVSKDNVDTERYLQHKIEGTAASFLDRSGNSCNIQLTYLDKPVPEDSLWLVSQDSGAAYYNFLLDRRNVKYGYIDYRNKEILPFKYSYLSPRRPGTLMFYQYEKGQKYGLLNYDLTTRTDTIYAGFFRLTDSNYALKKSSEWALTNASGIALTPFKYDSLSPPRYIHWSSPARYFAAIRGDSCTIISADGTEILPWKKHSCGDCFCARLFYHDKKYGIIAFDGDTIDQGYSYCRRIDAADRYMLPDPYCYWHGWYLLNKGGILQNDTIAGGHWFIVDLYDGGMIVGRSGFIRLSPRKNYLRVEYAYEGGRRKFKLKKHRIIW